MSPFYRSVLGALGTEALLNDLLNSGELRKCFAAQPWAFALTEGRLKADPRWVSEFGYRFTFKKPADWVTTVAILDTSGTPIRGYNDEPEFIYCDVDVIEAQWISENAAWTPEFTNYVHTYFAAKAASVLADKAKRLQSMLIPIAASGAKVQVQSAQQKAGVFRGDGGSSARLIG
jgi:hypothetical protein